MQIRSKKGKVDSFISKVKGVSVVCIAVSNTANPKNHWLIYLTWEDNNNSGKAARFDMTYTPREGNAKAGRLIVKEGTYPHDRVLFERKFAVVPGKNLTANRFLTFIRSRYRERFSFHPTGTGT